MKIDRLRNLETPLISSCCCYDKCNTLIETKYLYIQQFLSNHTTSKLNVANGLWKAGNSSRNKVGSLNIFIIGKTFEDLNQYGEPWINHRKLIWLCRYIVFLRWFHFLISCNCPKACLKWNKLQSPKALCFSSFWKRQYVKDKHHVQEILCKQSLASFWIKKVIISDYRLQLCNNAQNALQFALRHSEESFFSYL